MIFKDKSLLVASPYNLMLDKQDTGLSKCH